MTQVLDITAVSWLRLISGRWLVKILVGTSTVVSEALCGFLHFFQSDVGKLSSVRTWLLPSTAFQIHYLLVIPSFNAMYSELLTAF
jgi:hypothetical protein